ncbi:MAG: hypothetical protein RIQ60_4437 [Pseudomonadota bacterium]|jgi:hypothetical protein
MNKVLDAFWRAGVYSLHPRVILMSLLPLLLTAAAAVVLAWWFWTDAVLAVRSTLEQSAALGPALRWLDSVSGGAFRALVGPLVVVALSAPLLLITTLLLVANLMMPTLVDLVARRRHADLARHPGGAVWGSLLHSLTSTALALLVLLLTLPLWLIPPLALLLPPLIWGWLSARVLSFDALAEHASTDERRTLQRLHRWPLLAMGGVTGYLGGAPSLLWVGGALALPLLPLLTAVYVWACTLLFAFSALWFAHYCLDALAELRMSKCEHSSGGDNLAPLQQAPQATTVVKRLSSP